MHRRGVADSFVTQKSSKSSVLIATLVVAGLPLGALLWFVSAGRGPNSAELVVGALMYYVSGLGVTAGWHRLFTHKGFVAKPVVRNSLAFCGSLAFEGSLNAWVANHRAHHAHTDTAGDPHSPWTKKGLVRGLWHSHVGWLSAPGADSAKWARDIDSDAFCKAVSRCWVPISLAGMLLPAIVAGLIGGVSSFTGMLVWAGVVRVVLLHHVTWSTNSICHVLGNRPNKTAERSGNVWWLSVLSFGESWHNNHHSQPRLARHGWLWWQFDTTYLVLLGLQKIGLVSDCKFVAVPNREAV